MPIHPGIYCLLLRLRRGTDIQFGRRTQPQSFGAGYYAYVGSAMGGLAGRLKRHLNGPHSGHWHIDSLLAAAEPVDVQMEFTNAKAAECNLAAAVAKWPGAQAIHGFGATDCKCPAHLFYFSRRPDVAIRAPKAIAGLPKIFVQMRKCYDNHAAVDRDPFQTLVSCILSLRTKDPVTHAAALRLFEEFSTPSEFQSAAPDRIAELIYPVGMFRQKAKRLVEIAGIIENEFAGKTPSEIDELTSLPGVGRKTANLVRSFAFHLPAICVDTHVHRITNLWGLVRTATPDETEQELRRVLPKDYWHEINPYLVQHGQQICFPRNPECSGCFLHNDCRYEEQCGEQNIVDLGHWFCTGIKNTQGGGGTGKKKNPSPFWEPAADTTQ